ncbi:MAG: RloB family protein [Chthoniobacteraceae bacterium]
MRDAGRTFLIVVEGEKSEPAYFDGLCRALGLKTARVIVHHPEFTDPLNLVEEARRLAAERREQAKKSMAVVPFDEVWVVFDTEGQHDSRAPKVVAARQKAQAHGVRLAVSNPSFDFWIRLHFGFTTTPYADGEKVCSDIKRNHHKGYDKRRPPMDVLVPKSKMAIQHAQACRKHWEAAGGEKIPSTDVDLLIVALNEAAH